jgi:hypothetical protein
MIRTSTMLWFCLIWGASVAGIARYAYILEVSKAQTAFLAQLAKGHGSVDADKQVSEMCTAWWFDSKSSTLSDKRRKYFCKGG